MQVVSLSPQHNRRFTTFTCWTCFSNFHFGHSLCAFQDLVTCLAIMVTMTTACTCQFTTADSVHMSVYHGRQRAHVSLPRQTACTCQFTTADSVHMSVYHGRQRAHVSLPRQTACTCQFTTADSVHMSVYHGRQRARQFTTADSLHMSVYHGRQRAHVSLPRQTACTCQFTTADSVHMSVYHGRQRARQFTTAGILPMSKLVTIERGVTRQRVMLCRDEVPHKALSDSVHFSFFRTLKL